MASHQYQAHIPTTQQQLQYQPLQGPMPLMQAMAPHCSTYQQQPIMHPDQQTNVENRQAQSNWTTVTNTKRLRSPDLIHSSKQTRLSDYWLQKPIETKNRFSDLPGDGEESNDTDNSSKTKDQPKPPPVIVYNVGIIQHIHALLNKITNNQYTIKTTGYETIKIQVFEAEHFKDLIKELDSRNTQYHTFRPKSEKTFRFVLRGLHHATDIEDIKLSLSNQGHEVVNIHNIKHRTTKDPLPMFYVDIKSKENNKLVYNIDKIGNNIIKCEPPHTKRVVPQCTRCQAYGQTKTYCRKLYQCVKCTGQHQTKDCTCKTRDDKVKCVNCGGDHPANFRGCLVHKQLQKKTTEHNLPGTSYAQIICNSRAQNIQELPNTLPINNITKLEEMLSKLMEQIGTMLQILTAVVNKLA